MKVVAVCVRCPLCPSLLALVGAMVMMSHRAGAEDVFASSAHMRIVADGEKKMMRALETYIRMEQDRLGNISSLLESVEAAYDDLGVEDTMEDFVGNPLNAFHLIRRFATTWKDIWMVVSNFQHYEALKAQAESFAHFIPRDEDYTGALTSMLRLQKMYLLPTRDLVQGQVASGPQATPAPAAPLSQRACFDLGQAAVAQGDISRAREWFEAGRATEVPPTVPPAWLLYGLAQIDASEGNIVGSAKYIEEAKQLDPLNLPTTPTPLPININKHQEQDWQVRYRELCRISVYQPEYAPRRGLTCEFVPSPQVPYRRAKVEWVHRQPDVRLFHDFVSDRESQRLRKLSTYMIQRAKVGRTVDAFVSNERVGKIAWLTDDMESGWVGKISKRIADVTGLSMTSPAAEPLQTSNYGIGGHYEPHFDHDDLRHSRSDVAPEVVMSGDRIATFMIYLNRPEAGGATVFPRIDAFTRPIKNAAIFWYNYRRSGHGDTDTLHAACPVLIGEKWVANKWIREFGQEFKRPCGLTPDV